MCLGEVMPNNPADLFEALVGTTAKILRARYHKIPLSYVLFKPYESPEDVFFRTTSIFTAPPICLLLSAGSAVYSGFYLLMACTMPTDTDDRPYRDMMDSAKDMASFSIQFLFATIFASLVNLIDLIFSVVPTVCNTLKEL